ncbi:hypothetical protein BDA96_07G105100 [Sorghum bicolor]|uniref:Uncharacterized protein n=1 Tax=Sorghum bicolor TaxID=4558 RepID=A0A921QML2_SORBI|nr:hypothetical protein BDA96_07G105100 [Sorghum bicolor]
MSIHVSAFDPARPPCCLASNRAVTGSPHQATASPLVCQLCRCIYIVVTFASTNVLHNPYCAIRLHKVFVLLIGSSSSSCRYPYHR